MKDYRNFYITEKLKKDIEDYALETGLKNTEIMRQAAFYYLDQGKRVESRFLVKKRSDPEYVKRNILFPVRIEQWIIDLAEEESKYYNDCGYSVILFQMLYSYIEAYKLLSGL